MRFLEKVTLPGYYAWWHYTTALNDFFDVVRNLAWFLWNFFSISLLARTFFSPWRRLTDTEISESQVETVLSHVIINSVMRLVGMGVRFITILMGFVSLILLGAASVIAFLGWLLLPLIVTLLLFLALAKFIL